MYVNDIENMAAILQHMVIYLAGLHAYANYEVSTSSHFEEKSNL